MTRFRGAVLLLLAAPLLAAAATREFHARPSLSIVSGVTATGEASPQWLAMVRKRLPDAEYDSVSRIRKPLDPAERAWAELIRSRAADWEREIARVEAPFRPLRAPERVLVVLGNRGASDAFTHDPTTIGFDLAALGQQYGSAAEPENRARIDRFFRHEYTHLMQKQWWRAHPWDMSTPLRLALAEMWAEGLGNYYSLSDGWRSTGGAMSAKTRNALATLEPRVVARLAALACTTPARARALTADLSWGRFDRKWGAVAPALWLETDPAGGDSAFRALVTAGPEGVWTLAERHLSPELAAVLREARLADSLCAGR